MRVPIYRLLGAPFRSFAALIRLPEAAAHFRRHLSKCDESAKCWISSACHRCYLRRMRSPTNTAARSSVARGDAFREVVVSHLAAAGFACQSDVRADLTFVNMGKEGGKGAR